MNYKVKNSIKKVFFKNEILHDIYNFFSRFIKKNRKKLSDREYIEKIYKENTGKEVNLDNPVTFNDKLLWLSLYDRIPLKTKCADKYLVREYISDCGYSEILNTLYGVYNKADEIKWNEMPEKFFIKTNHDSGTYALMNKKYSEKKKKSILKKIDKALTNNYYEESREWQYKDIIPKIICEKYLETNEKYGLVDYRFYCFNGQIGFIAVDVGTTESNGKHSFEAKRNIYDENFQLIEAKLKREPFNPNLIKKPEQFQKMKEIAQSLSMPFKHVRVDLYNIDGKIVFGEMTFCSGGGMQLLEPEEFNIKIGNMISLK